MSSVPTNENYQIVRDWGNFGKAMEVIAASPLLLVDAMVRSKYPERGPAVRPAYHKNPPRGPRCLIQRAGIASPHAEGDVLSGVIRDGEVNAFISGPTAFVGGVPLMRARNPWAIPEAST